MDEKDCEKVPARVRQQDAERKLAKLTRPAVDSLPTGELAGEESWKDTLLGVIRQIPPDAFERLAQRILREAGFIKEFFFLVISAKAGSIFAVDTGFRRYDKWAGGDCRNG
jgi:hypothetical protein